MLELICRRTCSKCRKAVALLDERGVAYRYREYTEEPLTQAELVALFARLGVPARTWFRTHEQVGKDLGLTGDEDDDVLIPAMAQHPTLLQRPIGVLGDRAVVGRPVEALLALVDG